MSKTQKAVFNDNIVKLIGGYHHVRKGYMVEIEKRDHTRQSVSFGDLTFPDDLSAENAFIKIFSLTPSEAKDKGHRKGVPILPEVKIALLEDMPKKAVYELEIDNIDTNLSIAY